MFIFGLVKNIFFIQELQCYRNSGSFLHFIQSHAGPCFIDVWYFPKRQLPKGIFPSDNFLNVQFPKRELPKSVPAAAIYPLAHPARSARHPLHSWKVAAWEIAHLESCQL